MKPKILSVGEIIWDIYPDKKVIGGAPLNFAAHSVLCGAESTLLSAVGADELGDAALRALAEFGVNRTFIKRVGQPTGKCLVSLDENAVPHYEVLRGVAYDHICLTKADTEAVNAERYDVLYFGTLIQREPESRSAVRQIVESCHFGEILCDVNLRPGCYDGDSVRFCLENATVLKISIEEAPILRSFGMYKPDDGSVGGIARALCRSFENLKIVLITLGKNGAYAYDAKDGREYCQSAIGDAVVSTVGAGDSFAAAWLTSYLAGKPLEACMKKAAEISGFVVAHTEAVPIYESEFFGAD